jgi:hypothetical protein
MEHPQGVFKSLLRTKKKKKKKEKRKKKKEIKQF